MHRLLRNQPDFFTFHDFWSVYLVYTPGEFSHLSIYLNNIIDKVYVKTAVSQCLVILVIALGYFVYRCMLICDTFIYCTALYTVFLIFNKNSYDNHFMRLPCSDTQ